MLRLVCSLGTSNGELGGVTLSGNARTMRQRCPSPSMSGADEDGVQVKVAVAPATSATGSVPGTAFVRNRMLPGSMRIVPFVGLRTSPILPTYTSAAILSSSTGSSCAWTRICTWFCPCTASPLWPRMSTSGLSQNGFPLGAPRSPSLSST